MTSSILHYQDMLSDELFMHRALDLAARGIGHVAPNPLVGCVIVQDNKIVGEGWHKKIGGPHAEVNAINSMSDQSALQEATLYVNLEPCAHSGRTPPCTDLLIRQRVKKVVICNTDPNPLVSGRGVQQLEAAGIEVKQHVLTAWGHVLNKRFFTFHQKKRPYIILKWAQTADGFMARHNHEPTWISNNRARKIVHKWRAEESAILVGTRTAASDNPQLTTREWHGNSPVRVTIDRSLKLSKELHLFDQSQPTICYNLLKDEEQDRLSFVRLEKSQFIPQLLDDLYKKNIQSLIVEGGACTLNLFREDGFWDEARLFFSPKTFGQGIKAPVIKGHLLEEKTIADNQLRIYHKDFFNAV